jgi:hypothetical protein
VPASPRSPAVSEPAVAFSDRAITSRPAAPVTGAQPAAGAGASPAGPAIPAGGAEVTASINAPPAEAVLSRVPTISTHIALWSALAAIVFVLQMLVASVVRQRRETPRAI